MCVCVCVCIYIYIYIYIYMSVPYVMMSGLYLPSVVSRTQPVQTDKILEGGDGEKKYPAWLCAV